MVGLLLSVAALLASVVDLPQSVWVRGAEREMNAFYGFHAEFDVAAGDAPVLEFSATSIARVYVNGAFAAYGPARAADGWMRIDRRPLASFVREGRNTIAIEVSNPGINTLYLPNREAFLRACVRAADGRILAATGRDFKALDLPRVHRTNRLSFQREFFEFYRVAPDSWDWRTTGISGEGLPLAVRPPLKSLERGAPYPDFHFDGTFKPTRRTRMRRDEARKIAKPRSLTCAGHPPYQGVLEENLEVCSADLLRYVPDAVVPAQGELPVDLGDGDGLVLVGSHDVAGFPRLELDCRQPATVWVLMDEIVGTNGLPNVHRCSSYISACGWQLQKPGRYVLECFQPYGLKCAHVLIAGGEVTLRRFDLRTYVNPVPGRAKFRSSDPEIDAVFAAAAHSLANNAVDLPTDCPGRERGAYFGDTIFTGRGGDVLLGDLTVERSLYENYAVAGSYPDVPEGMIPMCYPADVVLTKPYWIPAFGLWSVIQLAEYVQRSGDREMARTFRPRAEGLLRWFRAARNADGLLEELPGWVFVEWSRAAKFTKGVNYPTNMIYVRFLDAFAELFADASCSEEAETLRQKIRRESWNGQWFRDHSLRGADGRLAPQENFSEVCQALAFFSRTATPATHPDFWQRFVNDLGPLRKDGTWPEVWPSNMLFGYSLRFGLLLESGLSARALAETKVCCLPMALATGTLWEGVPTHGDDGETYSYCHGFASQAAWVIAQSALGLRRIDRVRRTVTVAEVPKDIALDWCEGTIPLPDGKTMTIRVGKDGRGGKPEVILPLGWSVRKDLRESPHLFLKGCTAILKEIN